MKCKFYSLEERKQYGEGLVTACEDYAYFRGNQKKIDECIKTRYRMLDLCKKRNDKSGVSFQNGYLNYFLNKRKNNFK